VFRNAAFAYRSLDEADTDQYATLADACEMMLEQGNQHIEAFQAITAPDQSR
jgi:hypothetical protein